MTFTVLVTAWNREQYIVQAVRSALRQEEIPEVVVVKTPGSSDPKLRALGVTLLHVPSETTIGSMIVEGFHASRGDFIAFLNDDDWFQSYKLGSVQRLIDDHVGLIGVRNNIIPVDDAGKEIERWFWEREPPVVDDTLLRPHHPLVHYNWYSGPHLSYANDSSYTVHRTVIEGILPVLPEVEDSEDRVIAVAAMRKGPVLFTKKYLSMYRSHGGPWVDPIKADRKLRNEPMVMKKLRGGSRLADRVIDDRLADSAISAAIRHGHRPTRADWSRYARFMISHRQPYRFVVGLRAVVQSQLANRQ